MLGPGLNHRGKHGMMTEGAAGDGLRPPIFIKLLRLDNKECTTLVFDLQ